MDDTRRRIPLEIKSPMLFSGDMAKLNEFTLKVLCAPELIGIDQDPLGKQAEIIKQDARQLVLAKPLEGATLAVGLFGLTDKPQRLEIPRFHSRHCA